MAKALYEKLDELESKMKPMENEIKLLEREYTEIADFLKNMEKESGE